jgi:hypothetical protein
MVSGIKDKNALHAGQIETAWFPNQWTSGRLLAADGRQKAISLTRGSP